MKNIEILKQLEEGKITAQEALTLLGQQKPEEDFAKPPPEMRPSPDVPDPANWVENLVGWVGDVVNDVVEGVQDLDIPGNISDFMGGTYGHYKDTKVFESRMVSQGVSGLTLVGKNAKVVVRGYDGDVVRLECAFDARRPDAEVYFHEENGVFQLMYDEKLMRHMSINCEVPRVMIQEILIASKNAKVLVEGINGGKIQLATKNDTLKAEGVTCTELIAQNRNAVIKSRGVSASNIHLETTNDTIVAEDFSANIVNLKTSNARIKTSGVNAASLFMNTTNSGLKIACVEDLQNGESVIEARTTNGGITFSVPDDIPLKIEAVTNDGKINCRRDDLNYSDLSKNYMQGESLDYAMAGRKLRVKLSTTNSSIKILDI